MVLIQRVIDKQAPQEVLLANDRDAGGRQFNINYLNELQPARPLVPVAELEAYHEASRPVEWHATSDKYHTSLKVTFRHETPEQGAQQVQQLSERVAKINSTQEAGPSLAAEVARSTDRLTVVRMTVAHADIMQLEVVAQELYRDREQLRPVAERQPGLFLRVDYPLAKDFNKELEYTNQGLSAEQIRAAAQRDEQQRETERQARLAEAQRQEREQRALEREAQRARENNPEARQQREQDDKRFNEAVLGAAAADVERPTRSYRSEQEASEQTAQFTHLKDAGVVLLKDWMHDNPPPTGRRSREEELPERPSQRQVEAAPVAEAVPAVISEKVATWRVDELTPNTTGRAEAWKAILETDGYIRTSDVRSSVDEQGIRRAEFDMYYRNEQPEIALIHAIVTNTNARAAAGNEKYVGVSIKESEQDRAERRQAASQAELQPRTGPTQEQAATPAATPMERPDTAPQGVEKKLLIEVDEVATVPGTRGQAEAVKEALEASGARTGTLHSTTDTQGVRHSELYVTYRTDQPELAHISQTLDGVAAQPGSHVIEHSSDRAIRHELARGQAAERPAATPEITR